MAGHSSIDNSETSGGN